jgi:hypothetical protein
VAILGGSGGLARPPDGGDGSSDAPARRLARFAAEHAILLMWEKINPQSVNDVVDT